MIIILLTLLLILILLMIIINIKEGFTETELIDWWTTKEKSTEKDKNMFDAIIKRPSKIYSIFGDSEIKNDDIKVQYSGESTYRDISLFDINFIPTDKTDKNIIIFPHAYYHMLHNDIDINELTKTRELNKKTNFCLFSVSNCACEERNEMFNKLSLYKHIDSCGTCLNNTNKCPGNHESPEYISFIKKYKFMICFENKNVPNYFTEKLINAYYGGTIPIYWGCLDVKKYINMDSILYLPPNYTELDINDLIEKIKILDNNDFLYKEMYEQPLFKKIPDEFNINKISEKVQLLLNNK